MTALEISTLKFTDLKCKTVDELKSIRNQANEAMRTVGDSPKFWSTPDTNGNSYSLLEHVAKSAQCWVEIKEGR